MLNFTSHLAQRCQQRGISKEMIDCVLLFGDMDADKCFINQKMANDYIQQIKQELKKRKGQK